MDIRGLPQGRVVSPVLYALYTLELKELINTECSILDSAIYAVNGHQKMGVYV
jgi:hypothetical protein